MTTVPPLNQPNFSISVEKLQYRYPKSHSACLNIPSWKVEAQDRVFLQGPSGSGKSTLLQLITGILPCQVGSVHVLNTPLHTLKSHQRDTFRAQKMGILLQQFNLIPYLSVMENICLPLYLSNKDKSSKLLISEKAEELLNRVHIPKGLHLKPTQNLSVGQQQRVGIVRALLPAPELLIVDEPTSSLDEHNKHSFMELLLELLQDIPCTLLFVSHDNTLQNHLNRTVHMSDLNHQNL